MRANNALQELDNIRLRDHKPDAEYLFDCDAIEAQPLLTHQPLEQTNTETTSCTQQGFQESTMS